MTRYINIILLINQVVVNIELQFTEENTFYQSLICGTFHYNQLLGINKRKKKNIYIYINHSLYSLVLPYLSPPPTKPTNTTTSLFLSDCISFLSLGLIDQVQ
jgi:hypothetical protein